MKTFITFWKCVVNIGEVYCEVFCSKNMENTSQDVLNEFHPSIHFPPLNGFKSLNMGLGKMGAFLLNV